MKLLTFISTFLIILQICRAGEIPFFCNLPKAIGNCNAEIVRWFFHYPKKTCQTFIFTGCHGNLNRFRTERECKEICIDPASPDSP